MKSPRTFSKRFISSTAMSEVNAFVKEHTKRAVKVSAWGAKHFFGISVFRSYSEALTSLMELSRKRILAFAACLFFVLAAVTVTVIGCGWEGPEWSVRFGWYDNKKLQRLPPLAEPSLGYVDSKYANRSSEEKEEANKRLFSRIDTLWNEAKESEEQGNLSEVREKLNACLETEKSLRSSSDYYYSHKNFDYNSAIDRLDALTALNQDASKKAVVAYLSARRVYDSLSNFDEVRKLLDEVPHHASLDDNVAYLRAGVLFKTCQYKESSNAFSDLIKQYPRSEKREASLYMFALSTLKRSKTWQQESSTFSPIKESVDDEALRAYQLFERVMREYPKGSFYNDARGWLGFISLRKGDISNAVAQYFRMLSDPNDKPARIEGLSSLRLSFNDLNSEEILKLENELKDEPQAVLAYVYYVLYNFDVTPGYYSDEEFCVRKGIKDSATQTIVDSAMRMMKRFPNAQINGAFALRIAQANLENENSNDALTFATKALRVGVSGQERLNSLWVKGVAEHRLQKYKDAKTTLKTLISESTDDHFKMRTRILLALAAEDEGDKETALEQYLAMNFDLDTAYYVDVFMTPDELASFIKNHPNHPKINFLNYSLGVRYFRAERWREAREAYSKVITTNEEYPDDSYNPYETAPTHPKYPGSTPVYEVEQNWILYDMKAVDDLERLDNLVQFAIGDEERAEALYQKASYIYERQNLLFYNPSAWGGERTEAIKNMSTRAAGEKQKLWEYMQDHESVSRALKLYLEVVRKYPNTKAAPEALYTAAICHRLLKDFNASWSGMYYNGLFAGERFVDYEDVRREYPKYRFPVSGKWKPSNRTVSDENAYPPLPKKPRLSWKERVTVKFSDAWQTTTGYFTSTKNSFVEFWENTITHWLTVASLLLCFILSSRVAASTRFGLRPHLKRIKELRESNEDKTPVEETASYPLFNDWRDKLCDRMRNIWQYISKTFLQLARDEYSRPVLVANLIAHATTIGFLFALGWTLYGH